ncbi:P-loop containing nucleoside triphosphate hydrolase protein [Acephala macrosclerotiorum]|nr:P-loop containing nucleoside triphosphate hydrolase protein [Acephala macrosclerotiorum]
MSLLTSRRGCLFWHQNLRRSLCLNNPKEYLLRPNALYLYSTSHHPPDHHHDPSIKRTRNIGIIAHIDAGKTTTTERMLYYSGFTRRIGDVDDGSTVTDFLPAERARGITIQSAAVTFHWPPHHDGHMSGSEGPRSHKSHTINLIDTPGHADFTFEVLRSLRILDGAVCILDGVAGVEAQTEKVWAQANNYSIPRIVFVNKLDRDGAAFERTVKEVGSRLRGWPAVCQIPWWEGGKGRFSGVGDAINLCALRWQDGGDGKTIESFSMELLAQQEPEFQSELLKARTALVEALCEYDEKLLETWLECNDDALAVPAQAIKDSLRRCILDGSGKLIPIFAGASFRNIGVQPLLDAVDDLLPDPTERPDPEISIGSQKAGLSDLLSGKLSLAVSAGKHLTKKTTSPTALVAQIEACALAFKVVNDARRGVLVYIRVYSGSVKRNAALWNTNLHVTERAQRLLQMQASDAVEIPHISAGQIGVIAGLKHARTGDTLISYPGQHAKTGPPAPLNTLQLRPIDVPPPVFFAAIEPHSLSEEKHVAEILGLLLREDPSLHVNVDEESGQMLLSGMGELHLEIARDRLVNDFKAKATMGNIEISYRECVLAATGSHRFLFDREVAGKKGKAGCEASISPREQTAVEQDFTVHRDGNTISIHIPASSYDQNGEPSLPPDLPQAVVHEALINGAAAALARGPRRAFPLHASHVLLKFNPAMDIFGSDTSPAALASAARIAVQAALKEAFSDDSIGLMEPVMNVVISCDEASLGAIVHDISSARGGHVLSLGIEGNDEPESGLSVIDMKRIYAPQDPYASSTSGDTSGPGQQRQVTATVPLKEMVGYLKHLRSLTGGRGTFVMSVDKFERLSGPREKAV